MHDQYQFCCNITNQQPLYGILNDTISLKCDIFYENVVLIIAPNSPKQHQSYLCDEGEPHYEVDDKQHGNKQLPVLP